MTRHVKMLMTPCRRRKPLRDELALAAADKNANCAMHANIRGRRALTALPALHLLTG